MLEKSTLTLYWGKPNIGYKPFYDNTKGSDLLFKGEGWLPKDGSADQVLE